MDALLRVVNRPLVAILAVAAIGGAVRLIDLDRPSDRVFDEVYYAKDGCLYAGFEPDACGIRSDDERYWLDTRGETSWVHPPLGKWAIAIGERLAGPDAFGWRVSSAVAGTVSVAVVAAVAWLLFGSALWSFVAGLLIATEHLHVVQSRIAMLDVFLAAWVVLGFWFLVLDRRWIERRGPRGASADPDPTDEPGDGPTDAPGDGPNGAAAATVPSPLWRPWRLAAGTALGAAIATKWSGVSALAAAALLALLWERTRRSGAGLDRPLVRSVFREGLGIVVAFALVPLLVYLASYGGWFVDHGVDPDRWWRLQRNMADYHLHLETVDAETGEPIHPYLSDAWTWVLMRRPVAYYYEEVGPEKLRAEIIGIGNPAVFWAGLVTIPWLAVAWRRRRDWRAGFVFVAVAGQYLPWFLASRPLFFFYMTPVTPFLALASTYAVRDLAAYRIRVGSDGGDDVTVSRSRPFLPVAVGYVVIAVGLFAWFWPVLTGDPLPPSAPLIEGGGWSERIWFPGWV